MTVLQYPKTYSAVSTPSPKALDAISEAFALMTLHFKSTFLLPILLKIVFFKTFLILLGTLCTIGFILSTTGSFGLGVLSTMTEIKLFSYVASFSNISRWGVLFGSGAGLYFFLNSVRKVATRTIWLRLTRQEEIDSNAIFKDVPKAIPLMFLSVLSILAIFSASLFLVIPGIILSLGLMVAPLILIDKQVSPVSALVQSWKLSKPHLSQIFLLLISLTMLHAIGSLFILGVLFTGPLAVGAQIIFYNKMLRS